jgi:hypothetical protein
MTHGTNHTVFSGNKLLGMINRHARARVLPNSNDMVTATLRTAGGVNLGVVSEHGNANRRI